MDIGLPREIKDGERRMALTPEAVRALVGEGHAVRMETGAGAGAGFGDEAYREAGAQIVGGPAEAFDADLVVKVKEIQTDEWQHLRAGGMLFCFLHLGGDHAMADALLDRRITGIAFETVEDANAELAILKPMSKIAGELAITLGANLLMTPHGGRGVTLNDARVVVVGAGTAGSAAALRAVAMGSDVTIVSNHGPRLAVLAHKLGSSARTVAIQPGVLSKAVAGADLVIGAVNIPGTNTPKLMTRADVASMGAGAVLMEICIDGGGISETAVPTTHSAPVYVAEGVTHYCVANIPAAVPRSASLAISAAILPYVSQLAGKGLTQAMRDDDGFCKGLQIHGGQVTHAAIAAELQRTVVDLDALLFSC